MEEENSVKKISFLKKIWFSITKFEKYGQMSAEGVFSALRYLALLMLLFSIVVSAGFIYQLQSGIKKGTDYMKNYLPDLSYSEGTLDVKSDEVIKIDTNGPIIDNVIIDTKVDDEEKIQEYISSIPLDNTGIIVLKDKALVKARGLEETVDYNYNDLIKSMTNAEVSTITKQQIIDYLTGSQMISVYASFLLLMIGYSFIIYSVSVLVDSLLIAILGHITVLITKLRLKFSAVYNMAVYALTLSIILNALYIVVNSITGFEMRYFQIMYTSIAYVYLVAAIFMIRIDFEKKQAELMKFIEEQENVKKDTEKNSEEEVYEDEKKDKDNNLPEDESTNVDEDNKKDEPDGSEA